jgi:predicted 3-demethylubiquinone-9 3-methyltransferase (glyoxalase superfamily)
MKAKVRTCLWFAHDVEAATAFYVGLIPDSRVESVTRFPHVLGPPHPDVTIVELVLGGTPYQAMAAGKHHGFNDAASIVIMTEDQAETDRLWEALTRDGGEPMPCGWLRDRWGLSWQIVPRMLTERIAGGEPTPVGRMLQAMLAMQKLDIAALEAAFAGA